MSFWLVRLKQNVGAGRKNGVYLFNSANLAKVPPKLVDVLPLETIQQYTNQQTLLLIRSGGIGDLIAMSVLQDIAPKTIVLTQAKHFPALQLWRKPPTMKDINSPIFMASNPAEMLKICAGIGIMQGEDIIEQGGSTNWYEVFYRSVNQPIGELRPQLIQPQAEQIPGCLIVSQSTSVNRTADSAELAAVARNYFHRVDIAHEQNWTARQYFDALAAYEYVISVDTSAIHIREGFGLPALGLYGSFTTDSRTRGYKYTNCIDTGKCTPCFKHGYIPCKYNTDGKHAPCLTGITDIVNQKLKEYDTIRAAQA